MTKQVRIENADTSTYKVKVFTERIDPVNGEWYRDSDVTSLDNPYDVTTKYIHNNQRIVIEKAI